MVCTPPLVNFFLIFSTKQCNTATNQTATNKLPAPFHYLLNSAGKHQYQLSHLAAYFGAHLLPPEPASRRFRHKSLSSRRTIAAATANTPIK